MKGQQALEFMMTYGWAFLVLLAAIGAGIYFGIFDPVNWETPVENISSEENIIINLTINQSQQLIECIDLFKDIGVEIRER